MRGWPMALAALWGLSVVLSGGCAAGDAEETGDCSVGSERCQCTRGGACDPGLECLSGICVDPNATPSTGGGGTTGNGSGGGATNGSVTVGAGGGSNCMEGCRKLDVLFAIDHSQSMADEVQALAATQAFTQVVQTIAAVNCGEIDYRIGVTDDNDRGFITGPSWSGGVPWFDSTLDSDGDIANAFQDAANNALFGGPTTPTGCEHVLTSAVNLLNNDSTGFVREDALLVLVLISDVDDYGAYDQGTITCNVGGFPLQVDGCSTPAPTLNTLQADLLSVKDDDATAIAAVVVAGDPTVMAGNNVCGQPASCCGTMDCDRAFHASRPYSFAGLQSGSNGFVANICDGPTSVPSAITGAFSGNIDLACKAYEPPK